MHVLRLTDDVAFKNDDDPHTRLYPTLEFPLSSVLYLIMLSPHFDVSDKPTCHSPLDSALDEEVGVLVLKHLFQVQPVVQRRIAGLLILELQRLIYNLGLLPVAIRRHGYVARAWDVKAVVSR